MPLANQASICQLESIGIRTLLPATDAYEPVMYEADGQYPGKVRLVAAEPRRGFRVSVSDFRLTEQTNSTSTGKRIVWSSESIDTDGFIGPPSDAVQCPVGSGGIWAFSVNASLAVTAGRYPPGLGLITGPTARLTYLISNGQPAVVSPSTSQFSFTNFQPFTEVFAHMWITEWKDLELLRVDIRAEAWSWATASVTLEGWQVAR